MPTPKKSTSKRTRRTEKVKESAKKRSKSARRSKTAASRKAAASRKTAASRTKEATSRTAHKRGRQQGRTARSRAQASAGSAARLEEHTVAELRNRASELDIAGRSRMNKRELIRAIRRTE